MEKSFLSYLKVFEWTKDISSNGIRKKWLNVDKELGTLYSFDYDKEVEKANPVKLVIARAHSFIIRNIKGHIFARNCKHFARFCKVGIKESMQWNNMVTNIKRAIGKAVGKPAAQISNLMVYGVGEGIERIATGPHVIGECFVIAFEGFFMCVDINKLYSQRKSGGRSFGEFVKSV